MTYNLNQNMGTEYDHKIQRRKLLGIILFLMVVFVIALLVLMGINKFSSVNEDALPENGGQLTNEEKMRIINETSRNSTTTMSNEEKAAVIQKTSQKSPDSGLTNEEKMRIINETNGN